MLRRTQLQGKAKKIMLRQLRRLAADVIAAAEMVRQVAA
jgi:hypothetical protein